MIQRNPLVSYPTGGSEPSAPNVVARSAAWVGATLSSTTSAFLSSNSGTAGFRSLLSVKQVEQVGHLDRASLCRSGAVPRSGPQNERVSGFVVRCLLFHPSDVERALYRRNVDNVSDSRFLVSVVREQGVRVPVEQSGRCALPRTAEQSLERAWP